MQTIKRTSKETEKRKAKTREAKARRKATVIDGYVDSQPGDEKPSKMTTYWARHGNDLEFPSLTTKPQQDHKKNSTGIKIRPAIDKRAQPYNELVRANVHSRPVFTIPSRNAKKKEVREYLYLILTNSEYSKTADTKPWLVCITINNWKGDGQKLRQMDYEYEKWSKLCPSVWMDVNKKLHYPTNAERTAVGQHLKEVIAPVVTAERKLEDISRYDCADEETLTEQKKKKKKQGRLSRVLHLMCMGSGRNDESILAHKEKMAI